jgi:tetratricopeptide (TPR) repeat protein
MKRVAYLPLILLFLLLLPGASPAQDVQSYIDQGIKHSQAGRYDQSLQAFEQAMKLKPNDPALITFKGIVFYAKGKNDLAMKEFETALKLNPNFGRAYYQRAMVYEKQEKFDQALADLKKAKSLGYGIDPDFIALMERKAAAPK